MGYTWQMLRIQIAVSWLAMMFLVWVGFRLAKKVSGAGRGRIPILITLLFNASDWAAVLTNEWFPKTKKPKFRLNTCG